MNGGMMNENEHGTGAGPEFESLRAEAAALEGELFQGQQDAGPGISTADMLRPLVKFACDVFCPGYGIQEAEQEAMADAYGALVDKWFPDGLSSWGVELNALLVTAAVFGPRVAARMEPRPAPDEKQNSENSDEEG